MTDIQGSQQSGYAGGNVEIGECRVQDLWDPDFSGEQGSGLTGHLLGIAQNRRRFRAVSDYHVKALHCISEASLGDICSVVRE